MRWDFFLFFAAFVVSWFGDWGLYIGCAGMAVVLLHGLLKWIRDPRKQRTVIAVGLVVSGAVFVFLLTTLFRPNWFGLNAQAKALLYVECTRTRPLGKVPASGFYYMVQLSPNTHGHGIGQITGIPDGDINWGDLRDSYRCAITNYGKRSFDPTLLAAARLPQDAR